LREKCYEMQNKPCNPISLAYSCPVATNGGHKQTNRKESTEMTTNPESSSKARIAQAMAYYIGRGETPFAARELAQDQIDWEDSQAEENHWKGPNDSLPLHSY
jgi:hypothetical protein